MMKGLGCLVIDLQDCFLKAMPDTERLLKRASFVVESCKLLDIPVYFSEQVPEKLGTTNESIKALSPNSFTFGKTDFSAWNDSGLQEQLEKDGISHLLVAGIETPICVYQTTIAARADDVAVTILSDAISCRRTEDASAVIKTLQDHQTLFLPSETVFYSILNDVKHPAFRDFTKLVKHYNA